MELRVRLACVLLPGAVFAVLMGGCGRDSEEGGDSPSLLFVATADRGELTPTGGERRYALTLEGVQGQVVAFTDRPERRTFNIAARLFFAPGTWNQTFTGDPPNAAVDFLTGEREEALVVELSRPRYRGSSLRFEAVRLEKASQGLAHYQEHLATELPRRFGPTSLFVDGTSEETICLTGTVQLPCPEPTPTVERERP